MATIKRYTWLTISLVAAAVIGIFSFQLANNHSGVASKSVLVINAPQETASTSETVQPDQSANQEKPAAAPTSADDGNTQSAQDVKATADPVKVQPENAPSGLDIINRLVTWGFSVPTKPRTIDTIIIHSNYNTLTSDPYSVSGAIQQFKTYDVSAHYLIDRAGDIFRLVPEKDVAYHAGVSKVPDGRTNVNDFSIGIEIITKQNGDAPTAAEYAAVKSLVADIKNRYSIKYVLGHDQIAPGRKTDPWNFDWAQIK